MNDAISKSLRRHAEKHRPPRTPEEEEAYRNYRVRMKMRRVIERIVASYAFSEPRNGRTGWSGDGGKPFTTWRVSYGLKDHRALRVLYRDPAVISAVYCANLDDPIRREWDTVIERLRDSTGLPVLVSDEAVPTDEEIASRWRKLARSPTTRSDECSALSE